MRLSVESIGKSSRQVSVVVRRGILIGKIEYRYYDLGTYTRQTPTNGVIP